MDWLMRVLFGFYPMMATEGAEGGGSPGEPVVDGGTDAGGDDPLTERHDQEPDAGDESPEPTENQMLDGIKKALSPTDPETAKKAEADAAAQKADAEFAAANKGKTPEEVAAAQAARAAEAQKKADAEEAAKPKKADDFQLTPQMKKHLSQEAQQRFHHLHRHAKEQEAQVAKLAETNQALAEARDGIIGVLQETRTSQDQLVAYLNFNALVQSDQPRDWKQALILVEQQRAALYKALGMEGPGVDLLAEYPDLQKRVEEDLIPREVALELANSRRREQMLAYQRNNQGEQARTVQAIKQRQDEAVAEIEKWSQEMAGKDINFHGKEPKLLAKLPQIIKNYPAHLWLPTFQALYDTIEVARPAPAPSATGGTLRPSGAKPGARQFTELTPDALRAGLGYPPSSG